MISYSKLKSDALDFGYCRNCLNAMYDLQLQRKDCIYNPYPAPCEKCKKVSNIPGSIRISSRHKLLKGHYNGQLS